MELYDKDGNGTIEFDEFKSIVSTIYIMTILTRDAVVNSSSVSLSSLTWSPMLECELLDAIQRLCVLFESELLLDVDRLHSLRSSMASF